MNIQWYPGHMTKTRRQMEADLKHVDIVVELVDARIPISSRNPDIDAICGDKPRIVMLNRADQADSQMNRVWINYFTKERGVQAAAVDSRSGTGVRPAMRVMMTVWLTPGRVYSAPSAAAAPQKLDTPGVSSQGIPRSSSASICSRTAP